MIYAVSDYVERLPGRGAVHASVRFRTVGDMTCTGGVESHAATIDEVVTEIAATQRHRARRDPRRRPRLARPRWRTASAMGYF